MNQGRLSADITHQNFFFFHFLSYSHSSYVTHKYTHFIVHISLVPEVNDFSSNRKWQDARLEREYEEKRKAEEILNQRRQERARLSSYIYSSPQNGDKRYSNRSQGNKKCISDGNKQPKKMMDGDPNDISEERSISKGNDVCSLSSLAITNKPCDLQTW